MVNRAKSMGCEIGNHSYSHPKLSNLSWFGVQNQIVNTANAVKNATGAYPTLLRPPYGDFNRTVKSVAGVPLILWNIDTQDWKTKNAANTVQHVMERVKDGDIILMHDIYAETAAAVERLVPMLLERGFKLVTVSELAQKKRITLYAGKPYYNLR